GPKVAINQIQVLASHNSYHVEPEPALLTALRSVIGDATDGFEYTHRPLADELDAGVRQVELDVFVDDPGGGRYAHPKLLPLLGLDPIDPALAGPGLKVLHVQEVDYRSTCPTFVDCLGDIRSWSRDHPGHLPITIQIEAKDDVIPDPAGLGFVQPLPWTAPDFATLEAEIHSVFDDERILSPGDVKGPSPSVAAAVRKGRWPTLREARGQVMFVLDDKGAKRDAYRAQVADVDDRLIFVDVPPSDPDAAVTVVNDPIGDAARIRDLVAEGFIVRTRADADTVEARSGDTTRRDAAFASGAQYVSTDYVFADDDFGTGYVVDLPGTGAARCNPVNAPKRCQKADLSG
ncbi:MAG: phosphatidylinositol-specific phospholipase C1-like protein, partial [Candidatus Limnocylindrales bacterium]